MKNFSDYLDKYRKIIPLEQEVRDVVIGWAGEKGIMIEREKVLLQKNGIFLKVSPLNKAALFLHKKELLKLLKERLGKRSPENIR